METIGRPESKTRWNADQDPEKTKYGWTKEQISKARNEILSQAPDRKKIESLLNLAEEMGHPLETWTPVAEEYDQQQFKSWEDAMDAVEEGKTGVGLGVPGEVNETKNGHILMKDEITGFALPKEVVEAAEEKGLLSVNMRENPSRF
ncbi:MAG: hypothetical protein ABIJ46_05245 [bacterium]